MPFSLDTQRAHTDAHLNLYFDQGSTVRREGRQWDSPRRSWLTAQGLVWLGIGAERGYFAIERVNASFTTALNPAYESGLGAPDSLWQERMSPRLMQRFLQWSENGVREQESPDPEFALLGFRDAYGVAAQLVSTQPNALQLSASLMFDPEWNAASWDTPALVEVFGYLQSVSDIVYAIAGGTARTDHRLIDDVTLAFTSTLNLTYGPVKARLSETAAVLADRIVEIALDLPLTGSETDEDRERATGQLNEAREKWRLEMNVLLERLDAALSSDAMAV